MYKRSNRFTSSSASAFSHSARETVGSAPAGAFRRRRRRSTPRFQGQTSWQMSQPYIMSPIPEEYREAIGDLVYGCDLCQAVCPWNRGVERRRRRRNAPAGAEPTVSLAEWLNADAEELVKRFDRLYIP